MIFKRESIKPKYIFNIEGGFQGDLEIEFSILINLETIKTSQIYLFVLDISGIESPLCSPFEIEDTASIRLMRSRGTSSEQPSAKQQRSSSFEK